MKVYLFSRTDPKMEAAFRIYYIRENLKAVQNISSIYFVVVSCVCAIAYFFNVDIDKIMHIPFFLTSLYISLFIAPFFYLLSLKLYKDFKVKKKFLRLAQLLVFAFSLFLISRGMLSTFFAMNNPRNSLTMYMVWLLTVGVFFVFEFYETLVLSAY